MRRLSFFVCVALIGALVLCSGLASCARPTDSPAPTEAPALPTEPTAAPTEFIHEGYRKITPEEAADMMADSAAPVILLDVRSLEAFNQGHIPNALSLPDGEIIRAGDVLPGREQTILVYCQGGSRSKAAANRLLEMGYTHVFDFGGIADWPGDITPPEAAESETDESQA